MITKGIQRFNDQFTGGIKMKVDAEIQQKVLTLCGSKVNSGLKIAVRERFYQLKIKEIELEKAAEQFRIQQITSEKELEEEVKDYAKQLDAMLAQIKASATNKPQVKVVDAVSQLQGDEPIIMNEDTTEEYFSEPEIVTPQAKPSTQAAGVRVRMQEVVEDTSEGLTDDEVPIEFVEGDGQR